MKGQTQQELGGWISMANDHWKEHRPKMYRQMVKSGKLPTFLKEAAQKTATEMDQLMEAGYTHYQAWEATRQTYLLLPQEKGVEEPPEKNWAWEIQKDLAELNQKVNEETARINDWL